LTPTHRYRVESGNEIWDNFRFLNRWFHGIHGPQGISLPNFEDFMRRLLLASLFALFASVLTIAVDSGPLLLQSPTLSKTQIAFAFGGDIWIVNRTGGDAQRLVTVSGILSHPIFSSDGNQIAYTGNYDGNDDVYVVAATGGEPRRLTYHPASDVAVGWTNDGKSILFRTTRSSYSRFEKLYTVPATGGFPT